MVETRAEIEIEDSGLGLFQETEEIDQDQNPGPDLAPMQVPTGIDSDVTDAVNMTIFVRECPNALTDNSSDQEDLDGTTLQMLSQGDTLNYAEMEGLIM